VVFGRVLDLGSVDVGGHEELDEVLDAVLVGFQYEPGLMLGGWEDRESCKS
jgi:hypothetical protein